MPGNVTTIGSQAFYGCTSLTSIEISASVTNIGDLAFSGCTSLSSIVFDGAAAQWNAITKGDHWNYNVPATEVVCSDETVILN